MQYGLATLERRLGRRTSSSSGGLCGRFGAMSVLLLSACTAHLTAQTPSSSAPPVEAIESGDLIWPKDPGETIPYAEPITSATELRHEWEKSRSHFLTTFSAQPNLSQDGVNLAQDVEALSFEGFEEAFGGQIGVGHVAILRKTGATVEVVEAMAGPGVRKMDYERWVSQRTGQLFWHGRVKDKAPTERAKIAEEAMKELRKPYDFFNFDLDDTTGFYCSKLVWLETKNGTGIILDDNPNPDRNFWLSPKQLLNSRHIQLLQNPGNYGDE